MTARRAGSSACTDSLRAGRGFLPGTLGPLAKGLEVESERGRETSVHAKIAVA